MKLKFASFENREEYEEAVKSGKPADWKKADADAGSPEELLDFLEEAAARDTSMDCCGEVHVFVTDRGEESSDDLRDHEPLDGQYHWGIFEEILNYLTDRRPETMKKLSFLAMKNRGYVLKFLAGIFHVYEHYEADIPGDPGYEEAVNAAFYSPRGITEAVCAREELPESEILKLRKYRDENGNEMTHADYYNQLFGWCV